MHDGAPSWLEHGAEQPVESNMKVQFMFKKSSSYPHTYGFGKLPLCARGYA